MSDTGYSAILISPGTPLPVGFNGLYATSTCHADHQLPIVYFAGNAYFFPPGRVYAESKSQSEPLEIFPTNTAILIARYDSMGLIEELTNACSWPSEDKPGFAINPFLCSECWKDRLISWGDPTRCSKKDKKIREGCACYKCEQGHTWTRNIDGHHCLPCSAGNI